MTLSLENLPSRAVVSSELLPLVRLLRRARGFALAFLQFDRPAEREQAIGMLLQALKADGLSGRTLDLRSNDADLLQEMQRLEPPLVPGDALFVLGLERSIPLGADFPPALVKINLARELFRDLPCPVVLVLPDYALTMLARQAPDFWAWRSGVFEIESEESPKLPPLELHLVDRELRTLSSERIRSHVDVLLDLQSEYEQRGRADREQLDLFREISANLRHLGELERAKTWAERAVSLAERLKDQQATGETLHLLAVILMDLGQWREAAETAQRAVDLFRSMSMTDVAGVQEGLALSLRSFGAGLGSIGNLDEALVSLQEALALFRDLAGKLPEKILPEVAGTLGDMSVLLGHLERREEALAAAEESVALRRDFSARDPKRFLPDLAAGLNHLGLCLREDGRLEAALAAVHEAVQIYRSLNAQRPDVFASLMASSLNTLKSMVSAQGRIELQLKDVASDRFVLIRSDLPVQRERELVDILRPERVIVKSGEGRDATYYLLSTPEALKLFSLGGSATVATVLASREVSPVPALDANAPAAQAPDRCVVLDQEDLVGFFDVDMELPDALRGRQAEGHQLTLGAHALAVELPQEIAFGSSVSLLVSLFKPQTAGEVALLTALPSGAELDIYIRSRSGFKLEGPQEASLVVTEDSETLPVRFRLRADAEGVGRIEVLVFHGGACLGRTVLAPTVTRSFVGESSPVRFENELLSDRAPEPDLTILIHEVGDPHRPTLLFRLVSKETPFQVREFGPLPLRLSPTQYFTEFFRDIGRLGEKPHEVLVEYLERKGAELFESLFPSDLRELFWSLRRRIRSLLIASEEHSIPWELCRPVGREDGRIAEAGFFCEEFTMARWILGIPRKSSLSLRNIGVIASEWSGLRGVEEEGRRLLGLAEEGIEVESIPYRYLDVLRAFASGTFDGIHLAGHGTYSSGAGRSRIVLDDIALEPGDLSGRVGNLGITAPLIFLNACQTGRADLTLTALGGWATRFLTSGAAAFLGVLWEVSDRGAEVFARTFYHELLAGIPIGEAVRQARFAIRSELPGDPSWLAYTLFADPLARVVSHPTPDITKPAQ